jgi:hypothetical protein
MKVAMVGQCECGLVLSLAFNKDGDVTCINQGVELQPCLPLMVAQKTCFAGQF